MNKPERTSSEKSPEQWVINLDAGTLLLILSALILLPLLITGFVSQ